MPSPSRNMRSLILLLIIGLILAAVALVRTYVVPPTSEALPSASQFLEWPDCAAPCWRGIRPGKSRSADVFRALAVGGEIPSIHLLAGEPYEGNTDRAYIITWIEARTGYPNIVVMRDNLVELVELSNYSRLTLGDVVQRFGTPQKILVFAMAAERLKSELLFYWPNRGISVSVDVPFEEMVKLDPTMRVSDFNYFAPTTEELMWQIPDMAIWNSVACTRANWIPWPGWMAVATKPYGGCK